jgi:methionyl-tRNA formyltransferase
MSPPLRLLFAGARPIGAAVLAHLLDRGRDVRAVLTVPREPNVSSAAGGREVLEADDLSAPDLRERLRACAPDLLVVVSYPKIIPASLFDLPRCGAINFHGALLPRYRGRAPVNWAIIHGETETGLTVHRITDRVDAGAVLLQRRVAIGPDETAGEVTARLAPLYVELLDEALELISSGRARWTEQDESQATWFPKRGPEDGAVDWNRPSVAVHNWIRALARPYPGAFTTLKGRRLYIWAARPHEERHEAPPGTVVAPDLVATRDGGVRLLDTEWEGGGRPALRAGERLGS